MTTDLSDEELMLIYQQGESKAFEELYSRYSDRVYGYLRKRVTGAQHVDDLHQIIFLKLHEVRRQYKRKYKFAPWLFVITKTSMLDYFRKQKRLLKNQNDLQIEATLPFQENETSKLDGLGAVSALSEKEQAVLRMRYGEDRDFEQIAQSLGTSSSNIRQQISRAVKKLRKLVKYEK